MKSFLLDMPTVTRRNEGEDMLKIRPLPIITNGTGDMFRKIPAATEFHESGSRPPAGWFEKLLSPRGLCLGGILAGACLLGLAWGGRELRSEPTRQQPALDGRPNAAVSRVDVLIQQLNHSRPAVRREAIVALAEIGPAAARAIPRLIEHLEDPDLVVRAHAARAAWRIGLAPEELVPVLAELLDQQEPQSCGVAALVLGNIGSPAQEALPALRTCMTATSAIIRLHAAESILKIQPGDSAALHELLAALEDSQSDARYLAVNALGSAALENEHAVYALEVALTDVDPFVAAAAGINLSRLNDPPPRSDEANAEDDNGPSERELKQLIADLSHSSSAIRKMAAIRLGLAGPSARSAVAALQASLEDEDTVVEVQAANALWSIERNADDILPVLTELLEAENTAVSVAAVYVLGRIRSDASAALPELRERLTSAEQLEKLLLAETISKIEPTDQVTLGILLAGLHDQEGDMRYLSAVALADAPLASHRWVEKELATALKDRNLRVQSAAGEALWVLRTRVADEKAEQVARVREKVGAPPADPEPADMPPSMTDDQEVVRQERAAQRAAEARRAAEAYHAAEAKRAAEAERAAQAERAAEADRAAADAAFAEADAVEDDEEPKMVEADDEEPVADKVPAIADASFAQPAPPMPVRTEIDEAEEGLKPIRAIRATSRMKRATVAMTGKEFPDDVAAERFAGEPGYYHGYGTTRGWMQMSFCWDAPAVFFKPLYFEDINLERYGIHRGCCQPIMSFGHFFTRCICLPYKLLISQPPCERIYTLGYERPNNCIPLYCYCGLGCPSFSKCCSSCCSHCDCPPCPFNRSPDGVCEDGGCCPNVSRFCPRCPDWSRFCREPEEGTTDPGTSADKVGP